MSETTEGVLITWNDNLEEYLADVAEKSQVLGWLHARAEVLYSYYQNIVSLPVIILSSFVGFFSVGSSTMFEGQEKLSSIILGIVSLLTGILNTIGSFYAFSKKNENHRVAKISYDKLFRFLSVELRLPRNQRISAGDLLKMVRQEYERLAETANPIPHYVIKQFHHRHMTPAQVEAEKDIALPSDVNGLEKVLIYSDVAEVASASAFSPSLKKSSSFKVFTPKSPAISRLETELAPLPRQIAIPIREPSPKNDTDDKASP